MSVLTSKLTPNKRFDTDPQQQRFAPLLRAGQSRRWTSLGGAHAGDSREAAARG